MAGSAGREGLLQALAGAALAAGREATVDGVIDAAGRALWASHLSLAVMQKDGHAIRMRYANIPPEVRRQLGVMQAFEGVRVPASQLERVAAGGRAAVLIGDVRDETEQFYARHQPGSVAAVQQYIDATSFQKNAMQALFVDGALWGGFTLGSPALSEVDVPAVTLFGLQLTAALERASLEGRLQQRRRELEALNSVATLRLDRPADTVALLEKVVQATGSDSSAVFLYDAAADEYVLEATFGAPPVINQLFGRFRLGAGAPSAATCVHVSELPAGRELIEAEGFRWFASVPLTSGGRPSGWLALGRRAAGGYSPDELRTAEMMSVQVSSLLERARLYRQLSGRVRQLSLLFELARAGAGLREVRPLLDRVLALMIDHLPCDAASILSAQGEHFTLGAWKVRPGSGLHGHVALANLPLDDSSVTGRALRERKATRVALADASGRTRLEMEAFGVQHLMAAPLEVHDRRFGALLLGRLADAPFTDDELELMESCAAQVSVLIEHVRLFDDLQRSYSSLEKAQAEVVRHERLAALGELSAVMAHEVRNPLGVIFNSLTALKRQANGDTDQLLLLGIVGEEADRLNRIVGDLLDFARPYEPERAPIEFEPVVASAIEGARHLTTARVRVVTELARPLPRFVMDGHLVRQALVNLVVNAIQAMPRGGTVTVRVSSQARGGQTLACIEVCDEGVGITPDTERRIFQPFFTTKATGTGLGLAVVKRIVDAHHGEISVRSTPGGGTTFTVTLPSG